MFYEMACQVNLLLDLPADLQEAVYKCLNVRDRARLNMALPKPMKMKANKVADRSLAILTKAIKKKRVSKLSRSIKDFLATIPKWDTTLEDISRDFSEVKDIEYKNIVPTLKEKVRKVELTGDDIKAVLDMHKWSLSDLFQGLPPQTFKALYDIQELRPAFRRLLDEMDTFAFDLVSRHANESLLEHLLNEASYYGTTTENIKAALLQDFNAQVLAESKTTREKLFRYVTVPVEAVQKMYETAVERFDVDGLEFYEQYLN